MKARQTVDLKELRDCLVAVANGDRQSFERLYRNTCARLFGICLRILSNRGDAEEVLQEVYLVVWRRAGQYDPAYSPITWLALIARHKAIDRLRCGHLNCVSVPLDSDIYISDDRLGPQLFAEDAAACTHLRSCLDQLTQDESEAIHAAFFRGSTYAELATLGEVPLGTIKSRVRRGLLKMRKRLSQQSQPRFPANSGYGAVAREASARLRES